MGEAIAPLTKKNGDNGTYTQVLSIVAISLLFANFFKEMFVF